jgi:DNA-3-methyladenine glycosylase II
VSHRRPDRATFPPEALHYLRAADHVLGALIDRIGPVEWPVERDLWWSLIDSITSQQISAKAATTIAGRLEALGRNGRRPTPSDILAMPDETLRAAGLSRAKVLYVKDLAARWLDGTLRHKEIPSLPDAEVIAELTKVKGIGVWTAEVILIFTLARPDVLPADDLGIQVAVQRLYGLLERPKKTQLLLIAEPWRPWRSLAARYLWRSLHATPVVADPHT